MDVGTMSEQENVSSTTTTGGSPVMVVEQSKEGKHNKQPYRLTDLQCEAPLEQHKRSRAPAVPSVAEELKQSAGSSEVKERTDCDRGMSSTTQSVVLKKKSSNTKRRESSPEAISMATLGAEMKTQTGSTVMQSTVMTAIPSSKSPTKPLTIPSEKLIMKPATKTSSKPSTLGPPVTSASQTAATLLAPLVPLTNAPVTSAPVTISLPTTTVVPKPTKALTVMVEPPPTSASPPTNAPAPISVHTSTAAPKSQALTMTVESQLISAPAPITAPPSTVVPKPIKVLTKTVESSPINAPPLTNAPAPICGSPSTIAPSQTKELSLTMAATPSQPTKPAQPIPAPVPSASTTGVLAQKTASKTSDKNERDDDDSIIEEIAELRTLEPTTKISEWSDDEEASGLPRSDSRGSRVSRAVRQLFCCGAPYEAPSEDNVSCTRDPYASGI